MTVARPALASKGRGAALRGIALTLCLIALSPAGAMAQTAADEARRLEETRQALEAAREEKEALAADRERLARELRMLRQRMITAAQDAQEREAIITNLERQLKQLAEERQRREDDLLTRQKQLAGTLSALGRLSRNPPQNILLQDGPPLQTVRGAQLLRAAVPALQDRAEVIADQLAALEAVELDIRGKVVQLQGAEDALNASRAEIDGLIAEKNTLLRRTDAEISEKEERVRALVEQASSLQDLVERLARAEAGSREELARPRPPSPESDPALRGESARLAPPEPSFSLDGPPTGLRPFPVEGKINQPVIGEIVRLYGEDAGFGQISKGITIATRPGARITAPFDGKAVYAGPFQNLGLILIIEHTDGYHSVLAGFSRVDVESGQWLLAGEPVGIVGLPDGAPDSEPSELYVELRRDGQPVNPLNWIPQQRVEAANTKVRS